MTTPPLHREPAEARPGGWYVYHGECGRPNAAGPELWPAPRAAFAGPASVVAVTYVAGRPTALAGAFGPVASALAGSWPEAGPPARALPGSWPEAGRAA